MGKNARKMGEKYSTKKSRTLRSTPPARPMRVEVQEHPRQARRDFVTMHAAAVALTASDYGILLAGASYAGKSSIAAALYRQGAFWAADDMVRIERVDDGWLLHPSWPIQHLRDASGVRSAIAMCTRRLAGPVRLWTPKPFRDRVNDHVLVGGPGRDR